MGRRPLTIGVALALTLTGALALVLPAQGASDSRIAYSLELNGEISPATASWVSDALGQAADEDAAVAIIRLDTPGGLDSSLRDIVKDILGAPMPVIVYVSPDGARAASAGAYITQAADVAAMAPATNIGSSTPISVGPGSSDNAVLGRKIRNDAAAYMRALAGAHGRNPDLGEEMVVRATNVTAHEALAANFIDFVSPSEQRLLEDVNGFRIQGPKAQVLDTTGLSIESHDMPFQYDVLQIIVNPTVAYLLLLVGLIGLAIEIFSPGAILPGVLGAISLLLGAYGTAQLPVTAAGIALLVVAVGLFVAEGHLNSHGVLGAGGVVALIFSGLLLFNGGDGAHVSIVIVVVVGLLLGGFLVFLVQRSLRARRLPKRSGSEEMQGRSAQVRSALDPEGQVYVNGALWRARLANGDGPVRVGDRVRVEAVESLTLIVRPEPEPPEPIEEGATQWQ